ncbi:MAG: hypothetical protein MUQ32_01845, partial [Chloroflexi bacterium]|nr:hypothetical protein [Chloroflexota bacterium]
MTIAPAPGRRLPSPEQLAGGLSAIVILAVALAIVWPAAGPPSPSSTPPASSESPATPSPTRSVDAGAIEIARAVNRRLTEGELALSIELEANSLDVPAIQETLRRMNPQLRLGLDIAARLQSTDRSRVTGDKLGQFYEDARALIEATLKASTQNAAAYRSGSVAILTLLRDLPDLNGALAALLDATPPPTGPSPSAPTSSPSMGLSATPSPATSAGVRPSPTLPAPT